jgi:phage terminase Nu1 subunit (DNA packaging protein)
VEETIVSEKVITKDQLRELILAENFRPSDLFSVDALIEDEAVKGHVAIQLKDVRGEKSGEYYHRKRTEEAFDKARKEYEEKLKAKDAEVASLKTAAAKSQVGQLLEKRKATRKLDERQVKFVQERLPRFNPQKPDELDKEFDTFLDGEIDEYKRIAKDVFGIEEDKAKGGGTGDPGTGPDTNKGNANTTAKYLDPKQNPMIKL